MASICDTISTCPFSSFYRSFKCHQYSTDIRYVSGKHVKISLQRHSLVLPGESRNRSWTIPCHSFPITLSYSFLASSTLNITDSWYCEIKITNNIGFMSLSKLWTTTCFIYCLSLLFLANLLLSQLRLVGDFRLRPRSSALQNYYAPDGC